MLATEFKAYWASGKFGKPVGEEPYHILIQLGDRDATQRGVQKMVNSPGHSDPGFGSSGSPIAIEYLAQHAYSQEPFSRFGNDVIYVPFSFQITDVIFEILSNSRAFTAEVATWAAQERRSAPVQQRADLQRWWAENKIHFEREDYKAVNPGRPIPSVSDGKDEEHRKADLPHLERKGQELPPAEPPQATPLPAPAQPPAIKGVHSPNAHYYIGATCAAILAVALAIAGRGRRGK